MSGCLKIRRQPESIPSRISKTSESASKGEFVDDIEVAEAKQSDEKEFQYVYRYGRDRGLIISSGEGGLKGED